MIGQTKERFFASKCAVRDCHIMAVLKELGYTFAPNIEILCCSLGFVIPCDGRNWQ